MRRWTMAFGVLAATVVAAGCVYDLGAAGFDGTAHDIMVGHVSRPDSGYDAVIWVGPGHERRTLGVGEARGINESGRGRVPFDPSTSDRVAQARLWDPVTGAAIALEDKGWWSEANAINDESVPVGSMDAGTDPTHHNGDVRIVKWDAYKRAPAA